MISEPAMDAWLRELGGHLPQDAKYRIEAAHDQQRAIKKRALYHIYFGSENIRQCRRSEWQLQGKIQQGISWNPTQKQIWSQATVRRACKIVLALARELGGGVALGAIKNHLAMTDAEFEQMREAVVNAERHANVSGADPIRIIRTADGCFFTDARFIKREMRDAAVDNAKRELNLTSLEKLCSKIEVSWTDGTRWLRSNPKNKSYPKTTIPGAFEKIERFLVHYLS